MRTVSGWLLGLVISGALLAAVVWAFVESRRELERERQLDRPMNAPRRVTRLSSGEMVVKVDASTQNLIGLQLKSLESTALPQEKTAYGELLDPDSLITLYSDLAAAEFALTASRAEYERLKVLHEKSRTASRRALESAEAQYRTDALRVRTARRRIIDDWGASLADIDAASRESLLDRLVRRQTVLARVQLPAREALSAGPTSAAIVAFGADGRRLQADEVVVAPKVDAQLQGQAFLLRFDSPEGDLRPGASVTAYLRVPGEPRRAVVLPRASVIRFEGQAWVYVRHDEETFARRAVELDRPTAAGWLATDGISAGEEVVVAGAQLLLSEELRAEIEIEDEGAE